MSKLLDNVLSRVERVYCDMDGVVADFEGQVGAIDRFDKEKGFFENLQPLEKNVLAIEIFVGYGADVKILTASPNEQADKDKRAWLKKHMPFIKEENIIICRTGETKADYIENMKGSLLFDDYSRNLIEWKENGGLAIKVVNDYDNEIGTHTKHEIPYVNTLLDLVG